MKSYLIFIENYNTITQNKNKDKPMKNLLLRPILFVIFSAVLVLSACGGGTTTTTTGIPEPPSPEELAEQGFLLPDLPRKTSEQLKYMIDNGEPVVIVDTRLEFFYNMGHIPQSINIVYDPNNVNPEGFLALPKDVPIVFYCD